MDINCYYATVRTRTGANEYRYHRGADQIGSATAEVSPSFPVTISGAGLTFRCEQEPGRTIFPGCSNILTMNGGTQEYARVIYRDSGVHTLKLSYDELRVTCSNGTYRFFRGDSPVAVMRRAQNTSGSQRFWDGRWEPQLVMMVSEPLPDPLALLMLSFPLIQVGL